MAKGKSRHDEVLRYLRDKHLYLMRMPTAKDVEADLKISRGSLNRILQRLVKKGKLEKLPRYSLPYRFKGK